MYSNKINKSFKYYYESINNSELNIQEINKYKKRLDKNQLSTIKNYANNIGIGYYDIIQYAIINNIKPEDLLMII